MILKVYTPLSEHMRWTQELGKIALLKMDLMRRGTRYRTVELERKLVSNLLMACDSSTLSWDLQLLNLRECSWLSKRAMTGPLAQNTDSQTQVSEDW